MLFSKTVVSIFSHFIFLFKWQMCVWLNDYKWSIFTSSGSGELTVKCSVYNRCQAFRSLTAVLYKLYISSGKQTFIHTKVL